MTPADLLYSELKLTPQLGFVTDTGDEYRVRLYGRAVPADISTWNGKTVLYVIGGSAPIDTTEPLISKGR